MGLCTSSESLGAAEAEGAQAALLNFVRCTASNSALRWQTLAWWRAVGKEAAGEACHTCEGIPARG